MLQHSHHHNCLAIQPQTSSMTQYLRYFLSLRDAGIECQKKIYMNLPADCSNIYGKILKTACIFPTHLFTSLSCLNNCFVPKLLLNTVQTWHSQKNIGSGFSNLPFLIIIPRFCVLKKKDQQVYFCLTSSFQSIKCQQSKIKEIIYFYLCYDSNISISK